ncbi:multiple C2 and transmembrane domain-containing protein 1 isoform X16 [Pogona vitticeps]
MEPGKESVEEPAAAAAGEGKAGDPEPASSFQARLWRNLQLGGKSKGSGKGAAERRSAESSPSLPRARGGQPPPPPPPPGKGDLLGGSAKWSGFRRRKHVLDRVFSSSQPNLCCSSAEPLEAVTVEAGSALRRLREHLLHHHHGRRPDDHPPAAAAPSSSSSASPSVCSSPLPPARAERGGGDAAAKAEQREESQPPPPRPGAPLSHQKSSSLPGTACLEQLLQESPTKGKARGKAEGTAGSSPAASPRAAPKALQRTNTAGTSNAELPQVDPGMYQLDVTLKRGHNLAARDRRGTSDPYVKFKIGGKEVFRSKTIHKTLNPVWEEKTSIFIEHLREQLYIKVFDYDFGLQDDFIGSTFLDLSSLEQNRPIDVTLSLKDPHYPDEDLGSILLTVLLTPKEQQREGTMLMRKSWKRSSKFQTQSIRLSDLHRKAQLWRGIVSITLIEGRELKAMDPNGLSDPYVKFRLGQQKYKSKIMPKTLNPQWREHFDLHLYEERGGIIEITVWDKDAGKKDDFIGRCQVDLSTLSKEQTHKLELPLEEGEGYVVLLVTLTASAAVSISDLPISALDDPKEQEEILKRYSLLRMFHNMKDVGFLQVKVIRAEGLMAADVTGKSDPFCVVELNNDRLLTHTVYKNLNPEWNKIFTFNIKDIHSVLEVTVYDEDRDRSADFLGKVAIPLLSVKASVRTLIPKEQKYIEEENRISKQLLLRNFIRMKRCVMVLINAAYYINSCFDWDSPPRSLAAFVV